MVRRVLLFFIGIVSISQWTHGAGVEQSFLTELNVEVVKKIALLHQDHLFTEVQWQDLAQAEIEAWLTHSTLKLDQSGNLRLWNIRKLGENRIAVSLLPSGEPFSKISLLPTAQFGQFSFYLGAEHLGTVTRTGFINRSGMTVFTQTPIKSSSENPSKGDFLTNVPSELLKTYLLSLVRENNRALEPAFEQDLKKLWVLSEIQNAMIEFTLENHGHRIHFRGRLSADPLQPLQLNWLAEPGTSIISAVQLDALESPSQQERYGLTLIIARPGDELALSFEINESLHKAQKTTAQLIHARGGEATTLVIVSMKRELVSSGVCRKFLGLEP